MTEIRDVLPRSPERLTLSPLISRFRSARDSRSFRNRKFRFRFRHARAAARTSDWLGLFDAYADTLLAEEARCTGAISLGSEIKNNWRHEARRLFIWSPLGPRVFPSVPILVRIRRVGNPSSPSRKGRGRGTSVVYRISGDSQPRKVFYLFGYRRVIGDSPYYRLVPYCVVSICPTTRYADSRVISFLFFPAIRTRKAAVVGSNRNRTRDASGFRQDAPVNE